MTDDYVTKPFHIEEVLLRIRAILRRTAIAAAPAAETEKPSTAPEGVLRFADLQADPAAHEVRCAGQPLHLSPTEFRLLTCLLTRPNRVPTKAEILQEVWRYDFAGDTRIVDTFIKYLRRKIDRYPRR